MTTRQLIFGNLAFTNLISPVNSSTTSMTVTNAAIFPQPGTNQYFVARLTDAATGLLEEIIWVTGIVSNTLTIVRGQEGTTPLAWNAGDLIANVWTAGQAASMTPGLLITSVTTASTVTVSTYLNQLIALKLGSAGTVSMVLPAVSNFPNCPNSPGACPQITVVDANNTLGPATPLNITAADGALINGVSLYSFPIQGGSCKPTLIGGSWIVL